jgi:molybdopterin-guanine dinucleotide biosynthesis protein A
MKQDVLCGIFVGGAAARMGGAPKGLLLSRDSGEPLVVRLVRLVEECGFEPVFVGKADAYLRVLPTLRVVSDSPAGIGPVGGLSALLESAGTRQTIALACDMPRISAALLRRLASETPGASVLAPRGATGKWEPLCARYAPPLVRPLITAAIARGVRSFQQLFESLDVRELALTKKERDELVDWDSPEDIER